MKNHPMRVWMLSLALLSACAADAERSTVQGDQDLDGPTQGPGKAPETSSGKAAETTAATLDQEAAANDSAPNDQAPNGGEEQSNDVVLPAPPTKKVLDIVWKRQETGYWCGPATTRIVISARETNLPSQTALANDLGTTTNGTDHVGLMVNVLNARWKLTGAPAYKTRPLSDPPSAAQRALLKKDLVARISGGYAIVANVVSGWRPPTYPGGTIYHYVAVVGYDEDGDKVLVADPAGEGAGGGGWANVPRTYWVTTEDLGTWVGGKGYSG